MAALVLWAGIVTVAVNRYFITDEVVQKTVVIVETTVDSPCEISLCPLNET